MPRPRIQVDGAGLPTPQIRPAVRPIDTYVYTPPGQSGMSQLARGLAELAPSLARFAHVQEERQQKVDVQKGQKLASEIIADRDGWAEFVKKNPQWTAMSPWVLAALYERLGTLYAAQKFAGDLRVAVDGSEAVAASVDISDFDTVAKEHIDGWEAQNLPQELKGNTRFFLSYSSMKEEVYAQERNRIALEMGGRAQKVSSTTQASLLGSRASEMFDAGAPLEEIGTMISEGLSNDKNNLGISGTVLNHAMVSNLVARAEAENDFRYLELLKHITTKDKAKLYDTQVGLEAYAEGQVRVARARAAQANATEAAEKDRVALLKSSTMTQVAQTARQLQASGMPPSRLIGTPQISTLIDQAIEAGYWEAEKDVTQYLLDSSERMDFSDGPTMDALRYQIATGEISRPEQILQFASRLSGPDEEKLLSMVERYRNNPSLVPSFRNDPALREASAVMFRVGQVVRSSEWDDAVKVDIQLALELDRERLGAQYLAWLETVDGQNANAQQREDWAVNTAFNLISGLLRKHDKMSENIESWLESRESFRKGVNMIENWKSPNFMNPSEWSQLRQEFESNQFSAHTISILRRAGLEASRSDLEALMAAQKPFHAPTWVIDSLPSGADSTSQPNPE